jgi:osmotically-inducible protein OsmY
MQFKSMLLFSVMAMAILSAIACNQNDRDTRSVGDSVKNALQQADLKDVTVSDDADKNTVTLGGTLHSEDAKTRAADVVKSAAGNRIIANEISVQPVGGESEAKAVASNLDDAIEHDYKAALIAHHLDKSSVHYNAKTAVLTLTGTVKNAAQREQAELLGSKVPNVRQVINQLQVHQ